MSSHGCIILSRKFQERGPTALGGPGQTRGRPKPPRRLPPRSKSRKLWRLHAASSATASLQSLSMAPQSLTLCTVLCQRCPEFGWPARLSITPLTTVANISTTIANTIPQNCVSSTETGARCKHEYEPNSLESIPSRPTNLQQLHKTLNDLGWNMLSSGCI